MVTLELLVKIWRNVALLLTDGRVWIINKLDSVEFVINILFAKWLGIGHTPLCDWRFEPADKITVHVVMENKS